MKKNYLIFFSIIFLVIIGVFLWEKGNKKANFEELNLRGLEDRLILFVGEGCPHCAKVEGFLKKENVRSKIQFEEREVFFHKSNAKFLLSIAKEKCHLSENEIGVPFLWTGEKCLLGDEPIINYFKEKIANY